MLFKFGKELFWTMFWVFSAIIAGYFILKYVSSANLPFVSAFSNWITKYSQPQ